MFRKLLIKIFIKNYQDVKDDKVRTAYGSLAAIVGIISNVLIGAMKIILGVIVISSAIIADGVNNITDAASSLFTLIGFKVASKKPDKDHPFGHQRFEYITGLVVSFLILIVGVSFFKDSALALIELIKGNAEALNVTQPIIIICMLAGTIIVKLWQSVFYRGMSKIINSDVLVANAQDSLFDCITTTVTLASTIVYILTKGTVNIDSIASTVVAAIIIISAIGLIKDTVDPLLGVIPSDEEIHKIETFIESYDGVLGIHDLVVHSYGPNMNYVTCHAEVSRDVDVMISHELMDKIEHDARTKLKIDLTLHMDPVDNNNPEVNELKALVGTVLNDLDMNLTFHDFRCVFGEKRTNLIFDVVVPVDCKMDIDELRDLICKKVNEADSKLICVIQMDHFYNRMTDKEEE